MADGLGHTVIGEDAVDIIVDRPGERLHLDHDVETDTLGGAAFGLKGSDLDLDNVVAQRDPVQRHVP